jgi:monoamine oxidase
MVVVVGAGLAGLVAAYELLGAGHNVRVLEASHRPGGRVSTLRVGFLDGLYAEAGATYVPSHHDLTMKYLRLFGLVTKTIQGGAGRQYFLKGRRVEIAPSVLLRHLAAIIPEEDGDSTDSAWPSPSLRDYDRISFSEWMRRRGIPFDIISIIGMGVGGRYGDGPDVISALFATRNLRLPKDGTIHRIAGGSDCLPQRFADALRGHIAFGARVVRIEHGPEGVEVIVVRDGASERIRARYLLCAVPYSVLRDIEIEPPFPDRKMRAIRGLRYTSVVRSYLQCRERYWEKSGSSGLVETDLPVGFISHASEGQVGRRGVLATYATGTNARSLSALSPEEQIAVARGAVEQALPGVAAQFEQGVTKCWDSDPYARGGYCWFAPGEWTEFRDDIMRHEGRVYFAGEHASPWPSWMQGALWSGIHAAEEIQYAVAVA